MGQTSKIFASFDEAVADIPDGASIAVAGFGAAGAPFNILAALAKTKAKDLTFVTNGIGFGDRSPPGVGHMMVAGRVKKVYAAFTAPTRRSQTNDYQHLLDSGEVAQELVPQGTLAERLRAAGAGIPAFYTPTAVGTELAEGRETRMFNGKEYLLEEALHVDYAFCRASTADEFGNLRFERSARNFNPIMATAAKTTIVEVLGDIVPLGQIDPDDVHTPGIYVHRMIKIGADDFHFPPPREPRK